MFRVFLPLLVCASVLLFQTVSAQGSGALKRRPVELLTPQEIVDELQKTDLVQLLNRNRAAVQPASSLMSRVFAVLFPGSPAVNALLATLYISGPPNFLLALCPPNIDPSSLSVMVAFAVGGLLGDTLFHLLPEIFLGEDSPEKVTFVMVEPNRNLLLGVAILVGFVTFVAMDKGLRIATGGGHDHSHGGHSQGKSDNTAKGSTTGAEIQVQGTAEVKSRKKGGEKDGGSSSTPASTEKEISASVKLGGLLNLIADFTHNITDGLALSSSFYASPTIGATTTVAVFFHEIPHEVGDFALLVQSGFSKRAAMGAQFGTALGAFLGTCIGIAIQEFGGNSASSADGGPEIGLFGTSLSPGDLLLPFTAGTFLYVGTVAVIPELLEMGTAGRKAELWKTTKQFVAMATGAGIMLALDEAIRIVREKTPPEKATFSLKFSPYQLYPGQSQEGEDEYEWYKREKYNDSEDQMKKFSALMNAYGVPSGISFDFHGTIANTINAHRLIQHYQEEPQGSPELANKIVDALYKAYFHSEAHPSAKETLLTAATEAGVPAADAEAFIDDESEGLQDVKMLIREQAMNGVDSVPTVVFEGKRRDLTLTGAKEIPEYVKTMEQIIKESE
ncbi:MAG: hypothetical protein M4579_002091 [Chaenotheca gracillima]|nr:MAG: hypothetical protein M4579_002091 [Chaenotheca gracillima]